MYKSKPHLEKLKISSEKPKTCFSIPLLAKKRNVDGGHPRAQYRGY